MVRALETSHPGKFKISERPAKDYAAELRQLDIESHGVVCKLGEEVIWKHSNHQMSKAEFDAGLETVLAALK